MLSQKAKFTTFTTNQTARITWELTGGYIDTNGSNLNHPTTTGLQMNTKRTRSEEHAYCSTSHYAYIIHVWLTVWSLRLAARPIEHRWVSLMAYTLYHLTYPLRLLTRYGEHIITGVYPTDVNSPEDEHEQQFKTVLNCVGVESLVQWRGIEAPK